MENYSRMKFVVKFLFITITLFIFFNSNVQASLEWSGNIKGFAINKDLPSFKNARNSLQVSNKNALLYTISDEVKIEGAYELSSIYEIPTLHSNTIANYRVKDFKPYLHDENPSDKHKTLILHNLNRLNLNINSQYGDFIIGRMPIAFGSSKSLNPTDVLTPFALNTIDKEERMGVDAIVYKKSIGEISFLELGTVLGEDFEKNSSAYYIRPRFNLNEFEITLTAMNFKEKNLIGFDLQHPIKDAGFWFESAFVDQNSDKQTLIDPKKDFFRFTTGLDYKFQSSLYLSGEYHFNGASEKINKLRPLEFIYLREKHYFIPTISYEFTPLLIGSMQTYYSTHDRSSLNLLKLEYSLTDNSYLSAGSFWSIGNEYSSEFGRTGKTHYLSARFYY